MTHERQGRWPEIGCAGWSIPRPHAGEFPQEGSHLVRYAERFSAVEINSSFYRPHRPATYARWAHDTPAQFRFALKFPREVTHERRLRGADDAVARFLDETAALGEKRGPLLVQLPPSLRFSSAEAGAFFEDVRTRFDGPTVVEPRHPSWFSAEPDALLRHFQIPRVAADPAVVPAAAEPGGSDDLAYYRLHGSPEMYASSYEEAYLRRLATKLSHSVLARPTWCIFDNTALGAATANALGLLDILRSTPVS